ncbi:carbohydrate-binding protein [Ruminiclostridium cellulolyticum]|uniref:Carbohydrate-binding family 25 protein n=1 Tax=Ruminiclostridium cellulolyticum (strain ATCC 35319 / DSM 5812 / JCM 6584 / H10) TaxID=394503 RepID=B8I478_RUMCH|nr:carbohydrate-binding protein [Ruminiclostridium cellulolyticum]ACL76511.1 carbohydrate-binding family 25 protein [Ruminiclostridium cellulolyticum H10]
MAQKSYDSNGVFLSKKTLYSGDKVILKYNGLLSQAGAEGIYVHIGYGENWDNRSFVPMKNLNGIFEAEIDIQEGKICGICFKDSADNWDNNSGENYIFTISKKPARKKQTKKTSNVIKIKH